MWIAPRSSHRVLIDARKMLGVGRSYSMSRIMMCMMTLGGINTTAHHWQMTLCAVQSVESLFQRKNEKTMKARLRNKKKVSPTPVSRSPSHKSACKSKTPTHRSSEMPKRPLTQASPPNLLLPPGQLPEKPNSLLPLVNRIQEGSLTS